MKEILGPYSGSIIVAVVASVYFIVEFLRTNRRIDAYRERFRKEMDKSPDIYNGPTGEPQWANSRLPRMVSDYTEPRYVYENLIECTEPDPNNGRLVGYRISPTLVIHSRMKENVPMTRLRPYVERYDGSLLDSGEIELFKAHLKDILALREKAKDMPLENADYCWFTHQGLPVRCALVEQQGDADDDAVAVEEALLVLKR